MVLTIEAELWDEHRCELGEGPTWDARSGDVMWVDIVGQQVHRRAVDTPRTTVHLDAAVGAIAPCETEGWILALEKEIVRRSPDGTLHPLARFADADGRPPQTPIRANDAACDPQGRFWVGTMAWDATPDAGSLYRLDPHRGTFEAVLTGTTISNGIGWSPERDLMYYVDTATGGIDIFDFDPGSGDIHARRRFVEIPASAGVPDGLAVDIEGGVWVALWGGGSIHRYTPDGRLHTEVSIPCSQVTSCAFVGEHLDQLVITTARTSLDHLEPTAGMTFMTDPGVRGLPVTPYAR